MSSIQLSLNTPSSQNHQEDEKALQYRSCPNHRVSMKALLKKKGWKGKWSGKEEVKYIKFLKNNQQVMESRQTRRKSKVFTKMAKFLRSRSSDQCRSHHQKLIQYYQSIKNIVTHYEEQVFSKLKGLKVSIKDREAKEQKDYEVKEGSFFKIEEQGDFLKIEIDVKRMLVYRL